MFFRFSFDEESRKDIFAEEFDGTQHDYEFTEKLKAYFTELDCNEKVASVVSLRKLKREIKIAEILYPNSTKYDDIDTIVFGFNTCSEYVDFMKKIKVLIWM